MCSTCSSSLLLASRSLIPRMRLLKSNDTGEFRYLISDRNDIPPYAILSHTWGADIEEVSFKDIMDGTGMSYDI